MLPLAALPSMLPSAPGPMLAAVPVAALVVMLLVAYRHPPEWVEALVGVGCAAAAAVAVGLPRGVLEGEVRGLGPVVLFLVAILVVAECCRAEGLFAALGARLARTGSPGRLFTLVFASAVVTTVALSLDATVVLLTPVVLAAASARRTDPRVLQLACVRLANSASLLIPVANLTNLIGVRDVPVPFGRFALLMAPVWVVVLLVEYAGLRWRGRRQVAAGARAPRVEAGVLAPVPRLPLVVVALMLAGFAGGSTVGVQPFWVAGIAAIVLAGRALARRRVHAGGVVRHAHLSFALFVLCLGVVVEALNRAWLGDLLRRIVPGDTGLGSLLLVAALGAVLANVVNNLPATLILAPLLAPLGETGLLAALIGINVGSSMTWVGSLANLLWRRTVLRSGGVVRSGDFHLAGLALSPVAIVLGVLVLTGWSKIV